MPTQNQ